MTAEDIVRRFLKLWAAEDIDSAIRFVAGDAVYALYISKEAVPFGGETAGRSAIEACLREIRQRFEYLVFRPVMFVADGDRVRVRVEFMYHHRKSGEILSGYFRIVMTVRDGLIARAEEYHDRPMVEAFMRLFGSA